MPNDRMASAAGSPAACACRRASRASSSMRSARAAASRRRYLPLATSARSACGDRRLERAPGARPGDMRFVGGAHEGFQLGMRVPAQSIRPVVPARTDRRAAAPVACRLRPASPLPIGGLGDHDVESWSASGFPQLNGELIVEPPVRDGRRRPPRRDPVVGKFIRLPRPARHASGPGAPASAARLCRAGVRPGVSRTSKCIASWEDRQRPPHPKTCSPSTVRIASTAADLPGVKTVPATPAATSRCRSPWDGWAEKTIGSADVVTMRVQLRVDVDGQPVGMQRRTGRMARCGLRDVAAVVHPDAARLVASAG